MREYGRSINRSEPQAITNLADGTLDRIAPFEDGLSFVDYKSGRRILDEDDLRDEPAAQVYLLATQAIFRRPVYRVRFCCLESQDEISWWPEQEDIPALTEKLTTLTDAIRAATDFPAAPGDHCRCCPAARHCRERETSTLSIRSWIARPSRRVTTESARQRLGGSADTRRRCSRHGRGKAPSVHGSTPPYVSCGPEKQVEPGGTRCLARMSASGIGSPTRCFLKRAMSQRFQRPRR